ncbi:MAG: Sec7 domain-containing protein [Campylobacteraceae bacterium]
MIFTYEFTYISNNAVLENFLYYFAKSDNLDFSITKEKDKIFLHVNANEDDFLRFSDDLSNNLPISIFLKDTKVYVSEEFEENSKLSLCDITLPFTNLTAKRAKEEFNPFIKNEIGQNPDIFPPLAFTCKNENIEFNDNFKSAFVKLSDEITKNGANIKTTNGTFFVSTLENHKNFDDFFVMPTDLSVVDRMVVIKNSEILALASLEKPLLKLSTSLVFSSKYPDFSRFVKIGLANDLFLYLLSLTLFEKGVDFVLLSKQKEGVATLRFFGDIKKQKPFEVVVLENGEVLIKSQNNYLGKSTNLEKLESIKEISHRSFVSVLRENSLFSEKSIGFFLSKTKADNIMFFDEQSGLLDFVGLEYKSSIVEILEDIKSQDENAKRLIENYKTKFSDIYKTIEKLSLDENSPKNLYNVFKIISSIFGFSDNLENAAEKLLENAELFAGEKGPRFDYKLENENNLKTSFDTYKLIRSAISYKMADVDDMLLSFGLIESLVFFISDLSDRYKEALKSQNIALCGSLFSERKFSSLCIKHMSVNHKVKFNKELPLEF